MYDKILVTDAGLYVNDRMQCLKNYKDNLIVVELQQTTCHTDEWTRVVDMLSYHTYSDSITWYENVIILGDITPESLYVLDVLQKSDYTGEIHLILPMAYHATEPGTIQHEILSDLSKVKTLAVYDPYQLSVEKYGDTQEENIEKIIQEQTAYLLKRFEQLSEKMLYQSDSKKYFYDLQKDSYVDTESLYVLDTYEITHTLGLLVDPYYRCEDEEENEYFIECIQTPVPRPDGKQICERLRAIRKEFARLNHINIKFATCNYNGPCAGTCRMCDKEARKLINAATKLKEVKYPKVSK